MKKYVAIVTAALMIGGCAPKMGKDIFVEPEGNLRWENSGAEVVLGVLSLLGVPVEKETLRIGSDLRINNQWHSDLKIVSLSYALMDEKERFAVGKAKIDMKHPAIIPVGEVKIIPLELEVDPQRLNLNRIMGIAKDKRKVILKGDLVIEVWGIQKHYPFEKEANALIQKAFKHSGR